MGSKDLGILNPWLRNIRDVYRSNKEELNAINNEEEKYKRLVELNVEEQCLNVLKKAEIQIASRERGLRVHGWVFDVHSGIILAFLHLGCQFICHFHIVKNSNHIIIFFKLFDDVKHFFCLF